MKRIFTLLFLLFALATVNADIISKTYLINEPSIRTVDGYQTISFDETLISAKAGNPALPWFPVKLLLPPGHEAIAITFEGSNEKVLEGTYKLYPVQHSRPLSDTRHHEFRINEELYASDAIYPEASTGYLSTHFMNGYSYAMSTFTPVKYNPGKGVVSYYQTITITIETRTTPKAEAALSNLTANEYIKQRCMAFSQNPDVADNYNVADRATTDQYDILIITPESFSSQFQSLITHYRNQGLIAKISTIQSIGSNNTGIDIPEKMRNHIIQEYQNKGISQVILAGDVELIPYRGFYCVAQSSVLYEDAGIPSDLYFSALDGNWNSDGDQYWAEIGEDDLLPDISVGRLSFSNASELTAMLNKTLKYQNSPIEGELNNHLFAGEFLYDIPETWGSDYLEMLIGFHNENGYTTTGIPESYPIQKLYDETTYWMPDDLINTINSGKSFISHVGHANENYTMKLYNSDITNSNFNGANGVTHNFPIVYSHGCICGSFDVNDCIAERMTAIDNFAAAFVGNSRYGWFNEGQTEGPSGHLHREFMDALFTDGINRLGSAHMESKIATSPWVNAPGQWEEGALRWCFYDCNVLGDPAMAMWANEPMTITTTYPLNIPLDSTAFSVTITNTNGPVSGLNVVMIKDDVLIGTGITDQNGNARVLLNTEITEAGPAQIMMSGYNCKLTTYNTVFVEPSGIEDIGASNVSVFPNPVSGQINIIFNNRNACNRILIKDIIGKTIREISNTSNDSKLSIPTAGLKSGVYFISFEGSKQEVVKVIVK